MSNRLRRTLCVVSGAVLLVGLHGCRCRECRSRPCETGSYYGHTYEQPSYDLYAAEPAGPMLPPPSPAPATGAAELPPPIPQSELAPTPNRTLIQPKPAVPGGSAEPTGVPPAILPEPVPPEPAAPVEPAPDDSPFKGAMRSTREKVTRLFHRPHTSSVRQPFIRSSPAASPVRQLDTFPRSAAVSTPRTTEPSDETSAAPVTASARVAAVSEQRHALNAPRANQDRVPDDFVSPWADTGESLADRESLEIDDPDEYETAPIEIPNWPSAAARHPQGMQATSASQPIDAQRPIPAGTWVRISPRGNVTGNERRLEPDDVSVETQRLKRLDSPGPLLVPPKSE